MTITIPRKKQRVGSIGPMTMHRYPFCMDVTGLDNQARMRAELDTFQTLEEQLGADFNIQLLLQGHSGHNRIIVLDDLPLKGLYRADGVILPLPRHGKKLAVSGAAADCPMLSFCSSNGWAGELHLGTPELRAGAGGAFLQKWLSKTKARETFVIVSPHIQGKHYEWNSSIEDELKQFLVQDGEKQWFDLSRAVISMLVIAGIPRQHILASKKNTWTMAKSSTGSSYRWFINDVNAADTRDSYTTVFSQWQAG